MDNFSEQHKILDLHEGQFVAEMPIHQMVVVPPQSEYVSQLLRVMQLEELEEVKMNRQLRNDLLDACLQFYGMHINAFGSMKSLPVIRVLMES